MPCLKAIVLLTFIAATLTQAQTLEAGESQTIKELSPELEVRIIRPVLWIDGCLSLRIDRTNRAKTQLWLPNMGLYLDTSVTKLPDENGKPTAMDWINVFGVTDLIDFKARPIATGETLSRTLCLPSTIAVVNGSKKTRRQIELRGRLRIKAIFFRNEQDYLMYKDQREAMFKLSDDELRHVKILYPEASELDIPIPCRHSSTCNCEAPPPLLHGETRWVPDIYAHHKDWNERGQQLNDVLARREQECSPAKSRSVR